MKLATVCYLKRGKQTLMLHRIKKENDVHKDKWIPVGGKLQPGESPDECVTREVCEESGYKVVKPKLVGFITFPSEGHVGENWYLFVYTADKFSGKIKDCNEGELKWINDRDLKNLSMWDSDRVFMKWINGKKGIFSVKFTFKDDKIDNYQVVFHK